MTLRPATAYTTAHLQTSATIGHAPGPRLAQAPIPGLRPLRSAAQARPTLLLLSM